MAVALKATDEMIGEIVVLPNEGTLVFGKWLTESTEKEIRLAVNQLRKEKEGIHGYSYGRKKSLGHSYAK